MRGQLQRRQRTGPISDIESPSFCLRCISYASTGASRRTVAALVGKTESTLRTWINRGLAHPEIEPYGSFAVNYCRAERGIDGAIAKGAAMKVQLLVEQLQARLEWEKRGPPPQGPTEPAKPGPDATEHERELYDFERIAFEAKQQLHEQAMLAWMTPPETPNTADMEWMERVRERRFPKDYGVSSHREPDKDYSGEEWLEAHGLQREQLGALLADPPDAIREALVDKASEVYAILLAGGFDPQRKAEHETAGAEGVGQ